MPRVTVLPQGVSVEVSSTESVVDGLRRSGYRAPYQCRSGGCGACRCLLRSGAVRYQRPIADSVLDDGDRAAGYCLPCRAHADTDLVLDLGEARLRAVLATTATPTTTGGQPLSAKAR